MPQIVGCTCVLFYGAIVVVVMVCVFGALPERSVAVCVLRLSAVPLLSLRKRIGICNNMLRPILDLDNEVPAFSTC